MLDDQKRLADRWHLAWDLTSEDINCRFQRKGSQKRQSEPLRWENDSVVGGEYARKKRSGGK